MWMSRQTHLACCTVNVLELWGLKDWVPYNWQIKSPKPRGGQLLLPPCCRYTAQAPSFLLVLYPPLAFPLSLPPSPAPSQLSAHCTTKGWSRGCEIQASSLTYVCVYVCFFYYIFFLDSLPRLHTQPCPSVSFFFWIQQSRVGKHRDGGEKWGRSFCIFSATEQNNSEIIAPAVYSSITHRPKTQEKEHLHSFCLWGWTWWTNLGNLRNASTGFALFPINYRSTTTAQLS